MFVEIYIGWGPSDSGTIKVRLQRSGAKGQVKFSPVSENFQ